MAGQDVRSDGMNVSELARRVGVRSDTIRYNERVGLLHPPRRAAAEHRRYDESAVDRLLFIRGAQRLRLRLREIHELLDVRNTGTCPCGPAEVLLRRRLRELDDEMARLSALRRGLLPMADQLHAESCRDPEPGSWCAPAPGLTLTEGRCDGG